MKKLFLGLGLIALLAGCASHENQNGMGGSSEDYNRTKTDEYNTTNNSSDQFNNNATQGTGSTTAPNNGNQTPQ